jgi:hypothetical protein
VVREVPGTTSAFAERLTGAYYLDITPDLRSLAQYGVTLGEVQDVVAAALGGEMVTTILQGRERFSAIVRYPRELRDDPHRIGTQVLVPVPGGAQVPLGELARIEVRKGAPSIRTENAMLAAYIYVDTRESDLGRYVKAAQDAVAEQVQFPPGYYVTWSGQYEYMQRAAEKMRVVIPVTLALIFLLLYLNFRRVTESLIVMLSVPFALVGGIWLMWMLDYNVSVAVIVGFIALAGVAAETGVVMLIYLDHALEARAAQRQAEGRIAGCARPARSDHRRRGRPRAPEDDDRGRDHGRPAADHVEQRHRLRGHAPHRRADGGRHGVVHGADPGRDPGAVLVDQAAAAGQEAAGTRRAARGSAVMRPTFNASQAKDCPRTCGREHPSVIAAGASRVTGSVRPRAA